MKRITLLWMALLSLFATTQKSVALTYKVVVPEGTLACFIAGDMNGWNPAMTRMTKVDATHFTIDLPDAKETDKYQYLSGPDWKYIEKTAEGNKVQDRTWSAEDVVAKWDNIFVLDERTVTIEALVPAEVEKLYIVGNFAAWQSPDEAYKMTLKETTAEGKVFEINVSSIDAFNMEFKFCAGHTWSYQQTEGTNFKYETAENTKSVVVEAFNAIFTEAKAGTFNFKVKVPEGTGRVFIQGDFLKWNMNNALEGVKNADGTFSFTIPSEYVIEYRFYNKADWGFPEVNEEGNERPSRKAVYPADADAELTVINWKQNLSSVRQIQEASNPVYSQDGRLVVENVLSHVEIYNVNGQLIERSAVKGIFRSEPMNPGFYVLKIDGKISKAINN